jgi:hypothetical protein
MSLFKSPTIQLALAGGALACGWAMLAKVNTNFATLPVHQVQQVSADAAAASMPQIFPVWVERKAPKVEQPTENAVDAAFKQATAEPEAEAPPPPPSYADTLRGAVKVQGIADGGAFLNGQFYRVGGDVAALGIQSMEQGQVTPKLIAVSASAVTFRVGGERVVIEKGGAGWQ